MSTPTKTQNTPTAEIVFNTTSNINIKKNQSHIETSIFHTVSLGTSAGSVYNSSVLDSPTTVLEASPTDATIEFFTTRLAV